MADLMNRVYVSVRELAPMFGWSYNRTWRWCRREGLLQANGQRRLVSVAKLMEKPEIADRITIMALEAELSEL